MAIFAPKHDLTCVLWPKMTQFPLISASRLRADDGDVFSSMRFFTLSNHTHSQQPSMTERSSPNARSGRVSKSRRREKQPFRDDLTDSATVTASGRSSGGRERASERKRSRHPNKSYIDDDELSCSSTEYESERVRKRSRTVTERRRDHADMEDEDSHSSSSSQSKEDEEEVSGDEETSTEMQDMRDRILRLEEAVAARDSDIRKMNKMLHTFEDRLKSIEVRGSQQPSSLDHLRQHIEGKSPDGLGMVRAGKSTRVRVSALRLCTHSDTPKGLLDQRPQAAHGEDGNLEIWPVPKYRRCCQHLLPRNCKHTRLYRDEGGSPKSPH